MTRYFPSVFDYVIAIGINIILSLYSIVLALIFCPVIGYIYQYNLTK